MGVVFAICIAFGGRCAAVWGLRCLNQSFSLQAAGGLQRCIVPFSFFFGLREVGPMRVE